MKKILHSFAYVMCLGFLQAQTVTPTVIGSDGGFSTSGQGSIAWTIGEPISETYVSSGNTITTMGFHQPEKVINLETMIREQSQSEALLVFPNPVRETLQVDFKGIPTGTYKMVLVDAIGKRIYESQAVVTENAKRFEIKLNEIAAGNYFLTLSGKDFEKTVKINKIN